jgi:hypothetical protein
MLMLTREDLINIHEYIYQASRLLKDGETRILEEMDLSDEAWQETFGRLRDATEAKPA